MPFRYDVPLPPLPELASASEVRLVRWLVRDGARVDAGDAIAVVAHDDAAFEVTVTGRGFVLERVVREGAVLRPGAPIAVVAADGEDVPYGRPYSVARSSSSRA